MSNILQSIGRDAVAVEHWFVKAFNTVEIDLAPAAVKVIEAIRTAETNGILPAIAAALKPITGGLSVEVNNKIIAGIPDALAVALGIQTLAKNPTVDQIQAFESTILTEIGGQELAFKGQAYTKMAAQFAILIATSIGQTGGLTLAVLIADIEEAYEDMEQNIADQVA